VIDVIQQFHARAADRLHDLHAPTGVVALVIRMDRPFELS
jgi:hypothetical protein